MADNETTSCGSCGSTDLTEILNLGSQPLAERESKPYPLVLLQCGECTLIQLSYQVDAREVFPPEHPYATGNTRALREHFAELAVLLSVQTEPGDLVVDIGANDGTLLGAYANNLRKAAVEPTNQAVKCRERGIPTWQEFFSPDAARDIVFQQGKARVITACNVLAHVADPHDFLNGVSLLLADDGIFVTENHDVNAILRGLQIDTVYHEHLRYYSIASLSYLLGRHGLEVVATEHIHTHGGSFRTYARRQAGRGLTLQARAHEAVSRLYDLVSVAGQEGDIWGIGATTRATPLIHYAGLRDLITFVCEVPGSEKIGTCIPGTGIPVVPEALLIEKQPPYALLLSWHLADSIVPSLRAAGYKGKIIVPLPEPGFYSG
jgi:hypothetical protein